MGPKSNPLKLFLVRIWFPMLFGGGPVAVAAAGSLWNGLWFFWPLFLSAIFLLSVAEAKAETNAFCYRRLLKWKIMDYKKISNCGTAWGGLVGFVTFDRLVFPWGRLYFVLDRSLYEKPFHHQPSELLRSVTAKINRTAESRAHTDGERSWNGDQPLLRCLVSGAVGALISFMVLLLLPGLANFRMQSSGLPTWFVPYDEVSATLFGWPWNLVLVALLVIFVIFRYDRPGSWVFAFMAGLLLPSVILGK